MLYPFIDTNAHTVLHMNTEPVLRIRAGRKSLEGTNLEEKFASVVGPVVINWRVSTYSVWRILFKHSHFTDNSTIEGLHLGYRLVDFFGPRTSGSLQVRSSSCRLYFAYLSNVSSWVVFTRILLSVLLPMFEVSAGCCLFPQEGSTWLGAPFSWRLMEFRHKEWVW